MSLTFSPILKTGLSLVPGKTHEIEFRFENTSEYDKNLFCTLRSPDGLLVSRNHFDVLVPAEGICIENLKITVPDNLRIFYSSCFFVLETTDAVLEEDKNFAFFLSCELPWKWCIEDLCKNTLADGKTYLGTTHIFKSDICKDNQSCLCLYSQIVCSQDSCTDLRVNSEADCAVYLNDSCISEESNEHIVSLSLSSGVNLLCIKTKSCDCTVSAQFIQSTDYVAACINPDYFTDIQK